MGEPSGDEIRAAQDLVDQMICTATLETFRREALVLEQTLRGPSPEPLELAAQVRFSGSGGGGVLALGCGVGLAPDHALEATWVVERARALGHRIEKRLRQFGIVVRLEAPESASDVGTALLPNAAAFRGSYLFTAGGGSVHVRFDGELDVARIASAGDVPLRDEGDIILF